MKPDRELDASEKTKVWAEHYRKFDGMINDELRVWYVPENEKKKESWLDRKRKEFWVNLNNSILKHFNNNKDK